MNLQRRPLLALAAASGITHPLGVRAQSLRTDAGVPPLNVAPRQPKARVVLGGVVTQKDKVCADALVRIFGGGQPNAQPTTNSTCC